MTGLRNWSASVAGVLGGGHGLACVLAVVLAPCEGFRRVETRVARPESTDRFVQRLRVPWCLDGVRRCGRVFSLIGVL